jgi:hypothetical protein
MATTTVAPLLPHWVEGTFEFDLLSLMIPCYVTQEGVGFGGPVWHDEDFPGSSIAISHLKSMLTQAREATSSLAPKIIGPLERLINKISAQGKTFAIIGIEEMLDFSADVNIAGNGTYLEVDHVLQSLSERFPEEIPYIEVAWGYGDRKPNHGSFGGGAAFITPEGTEIITTHGFLKNKKQELDARLRVNNAKDSSPSL